MRPHWLMLSEREQNTFRTVMLFLEGRLEERGAIDWALKLKVIDTAQKLAVLELLDRRGGRKFDEPWQSAWVLIEEAWMNPITDEGRASVKEYSLQDRLNAGDRSGALITEIVELVTPRLKIEPFSTIHLHYNKLAKTPKTVSDLFSTELSGGKLVDLNVLKINLIDDIDFLMSLALSLDAAVLKGLDIERRIRPDSEYSYWHFGGLSRCYYVKPEDDGRDPDEFHHGIAPAVKLLNSVVCRVVELDTGSAREFIARLKLANTPIHRRLWASLSRDNRVSSSDEVGDFLCALDAQSFWNLHNYPEITELRARRFEELSAGVQSKLLVRVKKGPPHKQLKWAEDADQLAKVKLYWAIRELRRIEVAGTVLPIKYKLWMNSYIDEFPELKQMKQVEEGFLEASKAYWVPPNPDTRFDFIRGNSRLRDINEALHSSRRSWDDDPSQKAMDWIRVPGNCEKIISDFESDVESGARYSSVWEAFGWSHSPEIPSGENTSQRNLEDESSRVLTLLNKLPDTTLQEAIDGVSHWLSTWQKFVVTQPTGLTIWHKLWPIAVESTNSKKPSEYDLEIKTIIRDERGKESADLDTLNNPAGKLIGVFFAACPTVNQGDDPFATGSSLCLMRGAIEDVLGISGSIVKYRLIEHLPYFIAADKEWALNNLVPPLLKDSDESRVLWRAVARQRLSFEVLNIIGEAMVDRAVDLSLGREARNSFVFRIIIDCLYAFKDQRTPALSHAQIQQMIRSLDDEVRAHGADAVPRFVRDLSSPGEGSPSMGSPEHLFRVSVVPFLQQVWPQERSLSTPGVSKAFADLPAAVGEEFAAAVDAIERFLVPFDCWSMIDFGLYGDEDGEPKLFAINDEAKAAAFLRLLDLTVGTAERAVVPHDLANALDRIRCVAPSLIEKQSYRRLATAARRGR